VCVFLGGGDGERGRGAGGRQLCWVHPSPQDHHQFYLAVTLQSAASITQRSPDAVTMKLWSALSHILLLLLLLLLVCRSMVVASWTWPGPPTVTHSCLPAWTTECQS
jgi:hypothetical protein